MITAEELVGMTEQEQQEPFKLATVVELFTIGTAKVRFDGEEEPSEKEYSYLASYNPTVGDRVLLASVAGTYVIMDKIMYKEVAGDGSGSFTSLAVEGETTTRTLIATHGATIQYTLRAEQGFRHYGGPVGFYGKSSNRRLCNQLSANADLATTIKKVNEIIADIQAYGLYG